ncbi:hypothetical protein GGF39_002690 [Coemansia sp. RSA 1721]|nr:hypothetical protein GGF39_002690 [Coemansia sp. RSA 1721]
MDTTVDIYELLGIAAEAGEKEITKAYRVKALQYHPDKNRDNPDAARLFHDIKSAYDLLIDPKRRAEYDEKRRAQIAKRHRQNALSGQRKRMKSQLEQDERIAREMRNAERAREHKVHQEAARFRKEAQKQEERHDRKMRESIRRMNEEAMRAEASAGLDEVDDLDRSVRIRWNAGEVSYDRERLESMFSAFGGLEEVVLAPVAAHTRKRDPETGSALLVFKSIASAHALMNTKHGNAQLDAFSRFWAAGKEPQAVQDILDASRNSAPKLPARSSKQRGKEAMDADGTGGSNGSSFGLPDIDAIDLRELPGINMSFADFEALTLMRMRQQSSKASGSLAK